MKKEIAVAASVTAAAGLVAAVWWSRRSAKRYLRAERIVKELRDGCMAPMALLWRVADDLVDEMLAGLANEGGSSLKMLFSPTVSLPRGDEEGLYYGVEVRRTKICISRLQVDGKDSLAIIKQLTEVPLPARLMVGTSEELYDYLIAELVKAMSDNESNERPKGVGFTFPFPVEYSESDGTKIKWLRGFSIKESEGKDALAGINEAMKKHNLEVPASLLVNDCVGALAGGRYCHNDIVVAVILGSGTNAAYTEDVDSVLKCQGPFPKLDEMVINMEWENFKSSHFPMTEVDVCLDNESQNPGEQIYGKLVSGLYLGDIVRRALLKIAEETGLFGCDISPKFRTPFSLRTPDVASMHQDVSQDLEVIRDRLEKSLGVTSTSLKTRELVLEICDIFAKRAARLAGAGIVGVLKKLGRDGTEKKAVIVVKGALYEHYRLFRHYVHSAVKEMLLGKLSDNVIFDDLNKSNGTGAALLAAANPQHFEM